MGTGTLTDRSSGQTILEGFFNDIHSALKSDVVGRNSSGVPTSGQNLGTVAFPWGAVRANSLVIGGSSIDLSNVASPANRVVSGAKRTASNQPAFIDPAGAAGGAQFTVLATTTNLELEIAAASVSITSDIVKASLTTAPSSNNTALVNDAIFTDQAESRMAGEEGARYDQITIDTVGTEITSLDGQLAAFEMNSEYFLARVDTTNNRLHKCFRGFFMNSSLAPVNRATVADNDTITLMKLHYIFADSDGTTIDTTVTEPAYSTTAPTSPATGDYWFDMANAVWKRYDGATFQIVTRTFIGYAVVDDTDCVAARSMDFDARYKNDISLPLEVSSTEIIRGAAFGGKLSVAGNEISYGSDRAQWNITTDLATSEDMYNATEQASTDYYLYITDEGETVMSDISPYKRSDLYGYYHPHNPWRCVGVTFNDASNDLILVADKGQPQAKLYIKDVKSSGTPGGGFTAGSFQTRDINTLSGITKFASLDTNQLTLAPGRYLVDIMAPANRVSDHKAALQNITDSNQDIVGSNTATDGGATNMNASRVLGEIKIDSTKVFEVQHRCDVTVGGDGFGRSQSYGIDEIFMQGEITRVEDEFAF